MEKVNEVIVEGLDYQDFLDLKNIINNCTVFNCTQESELQESKALLAKIDEILRIFEE